MRRVLDQHPRQRDELPLAHREPAPVLADLGLQPVLERVDPVALADVRGGVLDLLGASRRAGVADVVGDGAGEEERQLRARCRAGGGTRQVERADVVAVDQDLPALELVEAGDQACRGSTCRRRCGRPARSSRPAAMVSVKFSQHRLVVVVAEGDVAELDLARAIAAPADRRRSGRPAARRRSGRRPAPRPTGPAGTGSRTRRCWSAGTRRGRPPAGRDTSRRPRCRRRSRWLPPI